MDEDKKEPLKNKRIIIIETDGDSINISKDTFETTPLEMCEICRRIIKMMKGS